MTSSSGAPPPTTAEVVLRREGLLVDSLLDYLPARAWPAAFLATLAWVIVRMLEYEPQARPFNPARALAIDDLAPGTRPFPMAALMTPDGAKIAACLAVLAIVHVALSWVQQRRRVKLRVDTKGISIERRGSNELVPFDALESVCLGDDALHMRFRDGTVRHVTATQDSSAGEPPAGAAKTGNIGFQRSAQRHLETQKATRSLDPFEGTLSSDVESSALALRTLATPGYRGPAISDDALVALAKDRWAPARSRVAAAYVLRLRVEDAPRIFESDMRADDALTSELAAIAESSEEDASEILKQRLAR